MAFRSIRTSINGSTATNLLTAQAGDVEVTIATLGGVSIFVGNSSVTASNGFYIDLGNGKTLKTKVRPGDEIWALSSGSVIDVCLLVRSA